MLFTTHRLHALTRPGTHPRACARPCMAALTQVAPGEYKVGATSAHATDHPYASQRDDVWILAPKQKPKAIVHLTGGAFAAAAPNLVVRQPAQHTRVHHYHSTRCLGTCLAPRGTPSSPRHSPSRFSMRCAPNMSTRCAEKSSSSGCCCASLPMDGYVYHSPRHFSRHWQRSVQRACSGQPPTACPPSAWGTATARCCSCSWGQRTSPCTMRRSSSATTTGPCATSQPCCCAHCTSLLRGRCTMQHRVPCHTVGSTILNPYQQGGGRRHPCPTRHAQAHCRRHRHSQRPTHRRAGHCGTASGRGRGAGARTGRGPGSAGRTAARRVGRGGAGNSAYATITSGLLIGGPGHRRFRPLTSGKPAPHRRVLLGAVHAARQL